jgi:hypothetical protein
MEKTLYCLSPSAAARWTACPGSEHIIRQLPRLPSTAAADEGTLAHAFAAWTLAGTLQALTGEAPVHGMPAEPEAALATDDMLNAAQGYADAVSVKLCDVFGSLDIGAYDIEAPVSLSAPGVEIRGRLDFAAYARDEALIVADYKYGSAPVPAKDNPQLLAYAACLADQCIREGWSLPPRIIIGIIQPRSEISDFGGAGGDMWYEYDERGFLERYRELKARAARACSADDKTERATGDHCRYCPARSVCRAAIGERLLLAGIAAGEAQMREDATDEQIGAWLTALKDMDTVREDLVRIAKARIEKGEAIPGWRTQARRGRIWARDIREAEGGVEGQARALAERLGAAPGDFITQSLKTPAQMAKTLPKETLADVTEETATTALVSAGG